MNALPQRSAGGLAVGVGSSGAAGAGLPAARVSAIQALQDEAHPPTTAPTAGSFLAMLSAADASALGESADDPGSPARSLPLAGPDALSGSDGATGNAALASTPGIAALLQPPVPAAVDPAMLLAQGALSAQPAPAPAVSAAASTEDAATAVALDSRGGVRSATAERFSLRARRLAGVSAGATAQSATPTPLGPAGASVLAATSASTRAPTGQGLEVAATSVVPRGALGVPAAPVQPMPVAAATSGLQAFASGSDSTRLVAAAPVAAEEGAAGRPTAAAPIAAGSAAGTVDLAPAISQAPGAPAAPAATQPSSMPVERPTTASVAAQAARLLGALGVDETTSPGCAQPDAPLLKTDGAEAVGSRAATALDRAADTTGSLTAVGVTERSVRRLPPVASGIPDAAGLPQGKGEVAVESAQLRVDAALLVNRFGRDEDLRSDGDGNNTPGAVALPAVSGTAPVGAVAPTHAAQAAGLHAASVERIVDQVSWWLAQNVGSAEFSIDMPGGLPLSVSVQVRGNEAQLIFRSDQPELRQLIGQALPQLKESFVQEGLLLAGASVSAQVGGGAAGGTGYGNHGGQAQPVPYHASGRQHGAEERVTAAAGPAPAPTAGRRAPFGAAGRSLDLYV